MAGNMVTNAVAKEEALERVAKAMRRRVLADEDWRKRRATIDLKLGEQIKGAFKVGLTAKQLSREIGLSVPRIYQLRDLYTRYLDEQFSEGP